MGSFQFTNDKISVRKSTSIFNYLDNSNMNAVGDSRGDLPALKNEGRIYVYLSGNHFEQNKVIIPNNNNVINIYCVYELQPIPEMIRLRLKMLYLVLWKQLKMLILLSMYTKVMVYVLMEEVLLVKEMLITGETFLKKISYYFFSNSVLQILIKQN